MSDTAAAIPFDADAAPQRFCPDCGYDLRGLASDRCPECGLNIDDAAIAASPIPWVHRTRIGRIRAFRRTVLFATFRPKRLAAAAAVPVDYRDAQRFRQLAVLLTALPFIAALVWFDIANGGAAILDLVDIYTFPSGYPGGVSPKYWLMEPAFCWSAGAVLPPVIPIAVLLTFAMIAAAPSYWFHPQQLPIVRQNRAVAISAYLFAPLVWLPLLAILGGGALALTKVWDVYQSSMSLVFILACGVAALAIVLLLLLYWWNTLRVLSRTTHASVGRLIAAGFGIPASALISILIGLGLFPALVGSIWLMIDSVR